jgi:type I restriction enzyme R subunit
MSPGQYTPAEGKAREEIDRKLAESGWVVQDRTRMNLYEGPGQAVREFTLKDGHGRVDYLLFVDQTPVGTIEAKPDGTTLIEVELQSLLYTTGLPEGFASKFERLPFAFESTGQETRFTNGLDPDPRSRRLFSFPRPETLQEWVGKALDRDELATTLWRLRRMPPLITDYLWANQERAIRKLEASLAAGDRRALIQTSWRGM